MRVIAIAAALAMTAASCGLLGSDDISVSGVRVSEGGLLVEVWYTPCMSTGSVSTEVEEFVDRVEIHVEGTATDDDCLGYVELTLADTLANRVLVIGPPDQSYENCGSLESCYTE